jgi:hypothetical protein
MKQVNEPSILTIISITILRNLPLALDAHRTRVHRWKLKAAVYIFKKTEFFTVVSIVFGYNLMTMMLQVSLP